MKTDDVIKDLKVRFRKADEFLKDGNFWNAAGQICLAEADARLLYFRRELHKIFPSNKPYREYYWGIADRILERFTVYRGHLIELFINEYKKAVDEEELAR